MGRSRVNFPVPAGFRMDPATKTMEPKYTVGITICPSDFGVSDDADNMTMAMAIQSALTTQGAAAATARAEAAEQRAEALEREVARLRAAGRVIACQWRAVDDMEELNYFALCWDLAYPDSAKLECDRGVPAGLALGNDPSLQDLVAALRLMLAEAQPAGEVSNG